MTEQDIKTYKFKFTHTNHSVFTGEIKAVSVDNLHTQMLSLLYGRYRRHIGLDNVEFEEVV